MIAFNNQYGLLFFLSWIVLYLIFPAWALPVSVAARAAVFFGLMIFFLLSAVVMGRWVNKLTIDKPVIVRLEGWAEHLKRNLPFVIVCIIAAALHLKSIFLPILIIGDETIHIVNGLWVYQYIESSWHLYVQIGFWSIVGILTLLRVTGRGAFKRPDSSSFPRYPFMFLVAGALTVYFLFLQDISYFPGLIRYPPVSKWLYFFAYSAFGIHHAVPRIIQLIFYLLCAVYLYRMIKMFSDKETALLGASIYLFLPIAFAYAYLGELASGTVFFIITTSFYFLRFIKDGDERDLLLATYLIGIGFLYKKPVLLMFPVCFGFLVVHKIIKRNTLSLIHFKTLSLALVSIVPWMVISKYFSWRNFQLIDLDLLGGKAVNYLMLVQSNTSAVIFALFAVSVLYVCFFKRNELTMFFGLVFAAYYSFVVIDMAALSPRFSMTFYPTVIIFISLLISGIVQRINWRYASRLCFLVLTAYLMVICTVSPLKSRYLDIMKWKLHYYPSEAAMKWVQYNVGKGEKILTLRIYSSIFYKLKNVMDPDKIVDLRYSLKDINTPEKLIDYYREQGLSYIMFPHSPAYIELDKTAGILEYLKNNPAGEFEEMVKFNMDDNFIHIYKLRE